MGPDRMVDAGTYCTSNKDSGKVLKRLQATANSIAEQTSHMQNNAEHDTTLSADGARVKTDDARPAETQARTAQRARPMVATSSERGTRSMRTSLMSDRITRVVSSTSSANTKVQIGSASWKRGSSCGATD